MKELTPYHASALVELQDTVFKDVPLDEFEEDEDFVRWYENLFSIEQKMLPSPPIIPISNLNTVSPEETQTLKEFIEHSVSKFSRVGVSYRELQALRLACDICAFLDPNWTRPKTISVEI